MSSICNKLFLALLLCSFFHISHSNTTESLDAFLQDSALKTLVRHRPHTGSLYKAILPGNLSGVEVSVVRLRSRRLWRRGANFSYFHIPPRTLPVPHVKRLAIVYQNMGNWSSQYYAISGYSLISSVVSFKVFDASNPSSRIIRKISLNTEGRPISIRFPSSMIRSGAKCVAFGGNGSVLLTEMRLPNVCYSQDQGHFSVAVLLEKRKRKHKLYWVIGVVIGCSLGVALVAYFGMVSSRLVKTKKIQVMERQADEDLVLRNVWVGGSKIPHASGTRTQPVFEIGGF